MEKKQKQKTSPHALVAGSKHQKGAMHLLEGEGTAGFVPVTAEVFRGSLPFQPQLLRMP